jgi:hypothetical protein
MLSTIGADPARRVFAMRKIKSAIHRRTYPETKIQFNDGAANSQLASHSLRTRPGADYERVLERLEQDLRLLIDPVTSKPAVQYLARATDLFGGGPPERLPDLFVEWAEADHFMERVVHPRAELRQTPCEFHRDSDHSRKGFAATAGPRRWPRRRGDPDHGAERRMSGRQPAFFPIPLRLAVYRLPHGYARPVAQFAALAQLIERLVGQEKPDTVESRQLFAAAGAKGRVQEFVGVQWQRRPGRT